MKLRILLLLSLVELLAIGVWFSASAVLPALVEVWNLSGTGQAWLTISVQLGFVIGALLSTLLNLADRLSSRTLLSLSAFSAAIFTVLVPVVANGLGVALVLRFLTGLSLAGVYPVGMKIMATWTKSDRGLWIGILTGSLAVGSASPHLLNALGGVSNWRVVQISAAVMTFLGGLIAWFYINEGPYRSPTPKFNWKYMLQVYRDRPLLLANLGYLGHMWELYAMWAWIGAFFNASYQLNGISQVWSSLASFGVIAAGGLGSLVAGILADRYGRTIVTTVSLVGSGICSLLIGRLFGANPFLVLGLALFWGFMIVADSAQYSASITELCQPEYTGTALTLQTSLGFLLTIATIRMVPPLQVAFGWEWAFAFLAIGPVVGVWAMVSLRRSPARIRLAGGRG